MLKAHIHTMDERRVKLNEARRISPAGCQPEAYSPERADVRIQPGNRPAQRRRGSKSTLKEVVRSFEAFQSCLK